MIDHRLMTNGKYEFLVKWLGYNDQTWEPASELRSNKHLHSYLQRHNLVKRVLQMNDRKKYGLDQVDTNNDNKKKTNNNKKKT